MLTKQVMSDDPSAHPAAHIAWYDCLHKDACREHSREDQATHVLSRSFNRQRAVASMSATPWALMRTIDFTDDYRYAEMLASSRCQPS